MRNINELSIVIPCYNEEDNIKTSKFLKKILKELNYEVIFVDNGSTDLTFKILEDEIKDYKNFKIIKLKQNQGYGGGIIAGIQEAKEIYYHGLMLIFKLIRLTFLRCI